VVTSHSARVVFKVEVHGRAAYSSHSELGVNAIEKASQFLKALSNLRGPIHPKMGSSTVNTLRIEGVQEEVMFVPDTCRIIIDRCLVPGYSSKAALEDLEQLIKKIGIEADAGFIPRETPFCDPFEISDNNPHVQLVVEAATMALGKVPEIDFHDGPSDSCILVNQGKVPTVNFGPSGGRLHESYEFVDIESVKKTTDAYKTIIRTQTS
jgi:acetylornithine deacetylase